ncbi:MAG: hypothetical protein AAF293_00960 [Pseudomonadota bacterium]
MTKKTGWFLAGIAAACAAALLTVMLSGAPLDQSSPSPVLTADEPLPEPDYTAKDVEEHFAKLLPKESSDDSSAVHLPVTPSPESTDGLALPSVGNTEPSSLSTGSLGAGVSTDPVTTRDLTASVGAGTANVPRALEPVNPDGVVAGPSTTQPTVSEPTALLPPPSDPEAEPEPVATSRGLPIPEPEAAPQTALDSAEVTLPTTSLPPTPQPAPIPPVKARDDTAPAKPERPSTVVPKTSARGVPSSTGDTSGFQRPQFPWPPPQASTVVRLPLSRFESFLEERTHGEVADLLERVLDDGEYFDRSYWLAPGGFALVTRLERITEEGTSVEPRKRWPTGNLRERFDLSSYLKALFYTDPGYFRVIVFLFSTEFERTTDEEPTPAEAFYWLRRGMVMLPPEVAEQKITRRHELTALIYEFERVPGSNAVVLAPGRLSGRTHLAQARLNRLLSAE